MRAAVVLSATALLCAAVVQPAGATSTSVVVSGLDNPRQLALAPDGSLVVAEAGHGAEDPAKGPCADLGRGTTCFGMTGAISRVRSGHRQRLATGLLSTADPDGTGAGGASGVSVDRFGRVYAVMTYVAPEHLPEPGAAKQNGRLLRACDGVEPVADLAAVELRQNPDGEDVNPNPYSVLALPDRQIVADAGGNTLLEVRSGRVRVLTVLPPHDGAQSVPTAITLGPSGDLYVAEFGGIGATPGSSRVYRISRGGRVLSWQAGFNTAVGVAFGRDGSMYVTEMFFNRVVKVAPDGTRTTIEVPVPSGIVADRDGSVYVSALSTSPSGGQIWRLRF